VLDGLGHLLVVVVVATTTATMTTVTVVALPVARIGPIVTTEMASVLTTSGS
jgi:hypothetical protein